MDTPADGYWCEECEVFEDLIFTEEGVKGQCPSCGCASSVHVNAQVVALP